MKIKFDAKRLVVVISLVCAVVILLSLIFLPIFKANSAVLKTRNFKITPDMMSYLVNEELNSYIDYHTLTVGDNYLDMVKLDKDKNLRRQKSVYGNSWFDYFYETAIEQAKEILLTCEDAKKLNITLTDAEKKEISELATDKNGISITKGNLKKILEYKKLSEKYKNHIKSNITENDYEKYYNENSTDFDRVDYKRVIVNVNVEENLTGGASVDALTNAALKKVEDLKQAIAAEGFDIAVTKYLKEIGSEETIEDLTFVSQKYVEDMQVSKWAFDPARKAGDIISFEGKHQYSIYYLINTPYPYDYTLNNGIIAFSEYDSSDPRALTKLMEKLEEKVNSDEDLIKFISENEFKTLDSSKLYKGDLPKPVSDWFYSQDRNSGDLQVCAYGKYLYIMKYSGVGESYFKTELMSQCKEFAYDVKLEELSKEINLKVSSIFKFLILR